jgi:hypothetical protein
MLRPDGLAIYCNPTFEAAFVKAFLMAQLSIGLTWGRGSFVIWKKMSQLPYFSDFLGRSHFYFLNNWFISVFFCLSILGMRKGIEWSYSRRESWPGRPSSMALNIDLG